MVHQQSPFRRHHLSELNVIWGDSVKPRDVRDLAFISLAYDSMLRESEMANVTFSMLSRSQKSGHYTGRISHIKGSYDGTDGQHGGRFQVSSHTYQLLVKAYEMTTDESDRDRNGLLFFPLTKGGKLNKRFVAEEQGVVYRKPLSGKAVDEIFQRAYDALLPDDVKSPWRGHSARIGRARICPWMEKPTSRSCKLVGGRKLICLFCIRVNRISMNFFDFNRAVNTLLNKELQ